MKKIVLLSLSMMIFSACKNENQPVPDNTIETPLDTIKKDTLVYNNSRQSGLLAINYVPVKSRFSFTGSQEPQYISFGKKITAENVVSNSNMLKKYQSLKKGDTVAVKFKSNIKSVCKKKGCWMKMDLTKGKETFVKFKDYEFFVPLNADNSNAIVSGKAFIEEISVNELRHYAKDGGKSQAEIDKINSPEITYSFIADGVLLQK